MLTKSETIGEIQFTVHTETGKDVVLKRLIHPLVYTTNDIEWGLWFTFINALVQSEGVKVPFEWPELTATVDELRIARDAWYALPGRVMRKWLDALDTVEKTPGDSDLLPPELISEKKDESLTLPESELILEG